MRARAAVLALALAACGGSGASTTTGAPGTTAGTQTTTTGAPTTTAAATTTTADSGPVAVVAVVPYPLEMADFASNSAPDLGVTMALVTGSPLKAIFSATDEFPGDCLGFTIWSPDFLTQYANGHVDIKPDGCEGAEVVFGEDEIVIRTGRTIVVELGDLPDAPFIPAFQVLDAGFQSGFYSRPLLIPAEPDEVTDLGPGLIVNVLGGENFEIGADGAWAVADFPPAQPGICEPAGGLVCLNGDRFRVEVKFATGGATDPVRLITSQDDTGIFYFFDADNYNLIIKILNGCSVNNHYWVFIGGPVGTDADADVTIEDTNSTDEATYEYRPSSGPVIIDTGAFATCP
ncbi:MAG: hypothetical protein WD184_08920 [Acidimicrobiia bacterium]